MPDPTIQQSTRLTVTIPPRRANWFTSSLPVYGSTQTSQDCVTIDPTLQTPGPNGTNVAVGIVAQLRALNPAYTNNLNVQEIVNILNDTTKTNDQKINGIRTFLQNAGVLSSHINQFIGSAASGSTPATGVHLYLEENRTRNTHSNMSTGSNIGAVAGAALGVAGILAIAGAANFWNPGGWGLLGTAAIITGAVVVGAAIGAVGGWIRSLF